MSRISLLLIVSLLSIATQASMPPHREDFVCPIGGEQFRALAETSGTSYGTFLDMKPYGPIAAPWPLVKCPSNGFVIFQREFTDAERSRLETYVASADYQQHRRNHTNYYLAALLQRQIQAPLSQIAPTLLRATWEARDWQYTDYAKETLDAYVSLLQTEPSESKRRVTYQLIAGELERRLGKFEAASKRFLALQTDTNLNKTEKRVIEYQLQLISEGNTTTQPIPRDNRE